MKPVGQYVSKEGINRAERSGKDERGEYLGQEGSQNAGNGGGLIGSVGSGVSNGVSGGVEGVKGIFGGKK